LTITKLSVVAFSALASAMASMRTNIYDLVGESSILSLVSLFVPLTLGLYWRKATSAGAILSMVSGIATWAIFEFSAITDLPSLVPATLVSLLAMIVGSLLSWKEMPLKP
jgi:solute:Na+ symporter, SSS family